MQALPHRKSSIREVVIGPSCLSSAPEEARLREEFLARLTRPHLRTLFDHWNNMRGSKGDAPLRRDISPRDLRELLPFLTIWELLPDKGFANVRLAGTEVTEMLMRETTGRTSIEAFPAEWVTMFRANRASFYDEQRPVWLHLNLAPVGRPYVDVAFLMLPLRREETGPACMGLGVFAPLSPSSTLLT